MNTRIGIALALALGAAYALFWGKWSLKDQQPAAAASNVEDMKSRAAERPETVGIFALSPSGAATDLPSFTNVYARYHHGNVPRISREQLEPFLAQNRRSLGALLGALRASGDDALLEEAKEQFPDDPRVQFAAAFKSESAEERMEWLGKFKQSAPDNALAGYLLAGEYFQSGHPEQALQELAEATGRPGFDNYLVDFVQNAEEAYHAGGYPEAEAKVVSMTSALVPELAPLKQVCIETVELAKRYQQAGDDDTARALQAMALSLGQRLEEAPVTLIEKLVGVAIERLTLNSMNPEGQLGDQGWTVKDQLNTVLATKKEIQALFAKADPALRAMSDEDLAHFYDRMKLYGEIAAMRWAVNRSSP